MSVFKFARLALLGIVHLQVVGLAWAQDSAPRPPVVSLPYVEENAGKFPLSSGLYGDGWQIDVYHDNDKPIFCDKATLRASIAKSGADCSNPVKVIGITIPQIALGTGDDRNYPARGTTEPQIVGYTDLQAVRDIFRKSGDESFYQYCGPVGLNLDCGYYCDGGKRKYKERWTDAISGGKIDRICTREGNIATIQDTVSCDPGYVLDPNSRNSCIIQCSQDQERDASTNTCKPRGCGNYKSGETWYTPLPFGNGTVKNICSSGVTSISSVECRNQGDFKKVNDECIRVPRIEKFFADDNRLGHDCGHNSRRDTWPAILQILSPFWTASTSKECQAGQLMVKGPGMRLPTSGRYRVRFHVNIADHFFEDGRTTTRPANDKVYYAFEAYSQSKGRLAYREIYPEDLKTVPGNLRDSYGMHLSDRFELSNSGLRVEHPERTKVISLDFDVSGFVPDLESRIAFYNGFISIHQIDIEFIPSQTDSIEPLYGCKDPKAVNYNRFATDDNGTCQVINPYLKLEASKLPGYFVNHYSFVGFLNTFDSSRPQDFGFRRTPGLAGTCSSFESQNFPGYYLRHSDFRIYVHQRNGTRSFDEDATFCEVSAFNGVSGATSLQSYNFRERYLRHKNYEVWIEPNDSSALFKNDASFFIH